MPALIEAASLMISSQCSRMTGSASLCVLARKLEGQHSRPPQLYAGLPYMARLRVFSRLIWPSAWPLLHFSAIAFLTAARSRLSVRANCCMEGTPDRRASSSHRPSLPGPAPRRSPRNRIASRRMTRKEGEASFNATILAVCDGVSIGVGFMHSGAATTGEICQPVAGSIGWASSTGSFRWHVSGRSARRHADRRRSR